MSAFFNKKNSHYIYLNKASCYRFFQLLKETKAWWKKKTLSPTNFTLLPQEHTSKKSSNVQSDKYWGKLLKWYAQSSFSCIIIKILKPKPLKF